MEHSDNKLEYSNFEDFDNLNQKKKIKKDVADELNNYKVPLFSKNSDVMSTLITKNMELNEQVAEYRINNSLLENKLNNIETDNHIKNTYASSKDAELIELKDKIKDSSKEIKQIKLNFDKSQSIIFWQRIIIIFELMLISLIIINNDVNIFLNVLK